MRLTVKDKQNLNTAYELAGRELVNGVRRKYQIYKEKPTKSNRMKYLKLRLALHLKMNQWPNLLELLDDTMNLGLYDTSPGELYWNIKP